MESAVTKSPGPIVRDRSDFGVGGYVRLVGASPGRTVLVADAPLTRHVRQMSARCQRRAVCLGAMSSLVRIGARVIELVWARLFGASLAGPIWRAGAIVALALWKRCGSFERERWAARRRGGWLLGVGVLACSVLGLGASAASADQCPAANPSYNGPCGPTFTLPEWGDAGGWTSADQYVTIQLGDVLGNGRDQLIGRSADGIEIWDFDQTLGQWRPAVDADGKPMILTGFADPPALTQAHPTFDQTDWTSPDHYPAIQLADVLGNGRDQIIARANSGIIVFSYTPGANGAAGAWTQLSSGGPFSNAEGFGGIFGLVAAASIHTADLTGSGKADVFGVTPSGAIKAYEWDGSGFRELPPIPGTLKLLSGQASTLQASPMINGRQELWWSDTLGVVGLRLNDAKDGWTYVTQHGILRPFAWNETSPTPWGQNPSYYETIRVVNITGGSDVEIVGRGVDGLDAWRLTPEGDWHQLPTLTAFSNANGWDQAKYWRTIQYANLDGASSGQREVIGRGPDGVVAYKLNTTTDQWERLPGSIDLADDPWGSDQSYFATLRVGDASGDGREDTLIARGPYGIRTWFYDRPGQNGWTSYLPAGYPAFPAPGQQAAYNALNTLAAGGSGLLPGGDTTIRQVWTGENAPSDDALQRLQTGLVTLGGCTTEQSFSPPQYQSCTPPAGSTSFTAQDWTAVLNEMFSEAWAAQQVVDFYSELDGIRQQLFISEGAELPAIAGKLNLTAAANTPTSFNLLGMSSATLGIAASVTFEFPELSAALWVASEVVSMIPSASPDLTGTFDGTYNQLQNVFATGITQAEKAEASQSLQVRSDLNLMTLVAQLRQRGTWALDDTGIVSASNEGFALSIYKTLLPLIEDRYQISNCTTSGADECAGPPAAPGVVGSAPNFTVIGPPPTPDTTSPGTPCRTLYDQYGPYGYSCQFQPLDASIADKVWGLISPSCDYQPGNPNTLWTFDCNLGVNPQPSIQGTLSAKEYWGFTTHVGTPTVYDPTGDVVSTGSGTTASLDQGANVHLQGTFSGVRPVDLSGATVVLDRVLYDPQGPGELLHPAPAPAAVTAAVDQPAPQPPALDAMTLDNAGGGSFRGSLSAPTATAAEQPPSAQLQLTPRPHRALAFDLSLGNVAIPALPAACALATAGLTSTPPPFPLNLTLTIQQPDQTPQTLSVSPMFTCQLDRAGAVRALTVVQPPHPKLGPGVSVRLRNPSRLKAGLIGTITATLHNRTDTTAYGLVVNADLPAGLRIISHTAGGRVDDGQVSWRFSSLAHGHSRTVRLRVAAVPGEAAGQCASVTTSAILRKPTAANACINTTGTPAAARGQS